MDISVLGDHDGPVTEERLVPPSQARKSWAAYRGVLGHAPNPTNLLTWPSAQPKTGKNEVPTYILHLAPSDASRMFNACPWATKGCRAACLNTAGRGRFEEVQAGRIAKTKWFGVSPVNFMSLLTHEIELARVRHGGQIALRLNGTSDVRWEMVAPYLFTRWEDDVIFYDYTKHPKRRVPANYHLTYSVTEQDSVADISKMLGRYGRVAVVFDTRKSQPLPAVWQGFPVVDGDKDDQRWQNHGVIVGLRAKGDAIGDTRSGFVRPGVCSTTPDILTEHFRQRRFTIKEVA